MTTRRPARQSANGRRCRRGAGMLLTKVRMPNAVPYVFSGLKVAVPLAIIGAVVAEFMQADSGLGYVVLIAVGNVNTPMVFVAVVLMAALSLGLFAAWCSITEGSSCAGVSLSRDGERKLIGWTSQGDSDMLISTEDVDRRRRRRSPCARRTRCACGRRRFGPAFVHAVRRAYPDLCGEGKGYYREAGIEVAILPGRGSTFAALTVGSRQGGVRHRRRRPPSLLARAQGRADGRRRPICSRTTASALFATEKSGITGRGSQGPQCRRVHRQHHDDLPAGPAQEARPHHGRHQAGYVCAPGPTCRWCSTARSMPR